MQKYIEEFHRVFGHPVNKPELALDNDFASLRSTLIMEEAGELWDEVWQCTQDQKLTPNLLKEVGDLLYVTLGLCVSLGIDAEACVRRVHESNMSKLGEDGEPIRRADGKILKGPNYKAPDMSDLVPQ